MTRRAHKSVKLFCSYSHRDERYLDKLKTCLAGLRRQGLIDEWHDRKILPGQEWEEAIDESLKASEIVLLLVTPDFMSSNFSYEKEMKRALDKHERGEARVIPIIVRPSDWEWAPFGKLQALPKDAKPITDWSSRDRAWLDVGKGIRKAVEDLVSKPGEHEQEADELRRYREYVESVWVDGELNRREAEWLSDLANNKLGINLDTAADIEREVMGDTKATILEREERTAKEEYRKAVAEAWTDRKLYEAEAEWLSALADELGLSADTTAYIEREVMGGTKEAVLERQIRDREEKERRNRLDELYAWARQSHQAQEWQAVVDTFDQIRAEDPGYPDPEELLASAREALKQARRVAAMYDQGLRHMEAEEWSEALECFEEVQRLEPGYQDTERLLSQVQHELTDDRTGDTDSPSTSPWEYVDLELEIREGDRSKYPVIVRSAKGEEVREEMQLPFDEQELEDKLEDLEKAVLLSGTKRRRIRSPEKQIVQDFGQTLFQALFGGQVGAYYDESLRKAKRQNRGLRLKLRIQPPELATLPWEFLYDPDRNAYLSLSSKTPLVRYVDLREPVEQLPVTPPLRILGMVASPHDLPRLEVEKEKRQVEKAIGDLEAKGRVELTWLEGQTSRDLLRAMRHGPWHIFHFIGHGGFDPDSEEGLIALADEEGNARFLRAENLAELLKDHWDLRLVLLNSCEGARGSEHYAFSSTAAALVRPGIPAVLANQYEISDEAAVEFSRAFYEAVADGLPLDAAVAGARTSVKIEIDNTLEWVTPVLYLQSPDGRVFDVQKEDPKEEEDSKEEDSPTRYRECVESAWVDRELHEREVEWLSDYANNKLRLSPDTTAYIEREVMGGTKEAVLERQIRDREEKERRNRLDELYAWARQSHQAQEWQAVVDTFDQIRAEDPGYPDPEELLVSAREALVTLGQTRRVAAMYDQGLQHIHAGEWPQALRCFEELQRLEPGYRETETLLVRVQHQLADLTEQGWPGGSEVQGHVWGASGPSSTKPTFLPRERKPKPTFLPGERKPTSNRPRSLPD